MKPKHLQFCLYYLQTKEPAVAYKMTYPKAGVKSLYAAASRLMARADVSAWIRETENRMEDRLLREINDAQTAKKEQLLSINEKRAVLTRIITGDAKRVRHIKTKYGFTKVEDDQPIYAVLRAIDMDTRLERFFHLLAHPDNFKKSPNLYINTPTLQQQVNILISQSTGEIPKDKYQIPTQEEIPKDKYQIPSHAGENSSLEGGAAGGGCTLTKEIPLSGEPVPQWREVGAASASGVMGSLAQNTPEEKASLLRGGLEGSLAKEIPLSGGVGVGSLTQDSQEETLSPAGGGVRRTGVEPLAQDTPEEKASLLRGGAVSASGAKGSLPAVSNRNYLTELNKIPLRPKLPRCIRHKKRKLHAQSRVNVAENQHIGTKWAE